MDLNSKKSWHPHKLSNQTKRHDVEQQALAQRKREHDRVLQLQDERARDELQQRLAEAAGTVHVDRVDWMYDGPTDGTSGTTDAQEAFLLGKRRIDTVLRGNDNDKLRKDAAHETFAAGGGGGSGSGDGAPSSLAVATSTRDSMAKLRNDPLMAMKNQEQAVYQAFMNNSTQRSWLLSEPPAAAAAAAPGDDDEMSGRGRKRRRDDDSESSRRRPHRRHRHRDYPDEDDGGRRRRHRSRRRDDTDDEYEQQRGRRRSRSPGKRRRRDDDDDDDEDDDAAARGRRSKRHSRSRERRRSGNDSRREGGERGEGRGRMHRDDHDGHDGRRRGTGRGRHGNRGSYDNDRDRDGGRHRNGGGGNDDDAAERARKLAAMQDAASYLDLDREKRLTEMEVRDRQAREADDRARRKSSRYGGDRDFVNSLHRQAGNLALEDRLGRGRHGLQRDDDGDD